MPARGWTLRGGGARHDRIEAFLPHLDELVTEGLVILDDVDVDVVRYVARDPDDGDGPT